MDANLTDDIRDQAKTKIELSVIVIAYNMVRELPRTLLTLSPKMQNGINADNYEIIVVDNGSPHPFSETTCKAISPNIRVIFNDPCGSTSPVGAINRGLKEAKGDLIGVLIDGARMASPGLLSTALKASTLSSNAVIGSLAFHLGHEVQMKSIHNGYNQDVEDKLLDTVPWQTDGYSLFDISVFAGSSATGWFSLPAETNALFMGREKWAELGGYDERFQSLGGGQANHDIWYRACTSPGSDVTLMFGEATFHQFHGGVATNSKAPLNSEYRAEYEKIRGVKYTRPRVPFNIFGSFRPIHFKTLRISI